jgi:hypothetical protein
VEFGPYPCTLCFQWGTRAIVDLGNALQIERSQDRFPMGPLGFLIDKHSGRIMVLEATQPVTEMSTRNIFLGVGAAGT